MKTVKMKKKKKMIFFISFIIAFIMLITNVSWTYDKL